MRNVREALKKLDHESIRSYHRDQLLELYSDASISFFPDYCDRMIYYLTKFFNNDTEMVETLLMIAIQYIKRSTIHLNKRNVHNMLLVSLLLAYKMYVDESRGVGEFFATLGGLEKSRLKLFEFQLVTDLKYNLIIHHSTKKSFFKPKKGSHRRR